MSQYSGLPEALRAYDLSASVERQEMVARQLKGISDRTVCDRNDIEQLNQLSYDEQLEFGADLTDYLTEEFYNGNFMSVEARLENLYSSLVLNPTRTITIEHIDVFAVAAVHAHELNGDKYARDRIESLRHTALKAGGASSNIPLPTEIVPIEAMVVAQAPVQTTTNLASL